jgi:enoyl-CoA hydratase
MGLVNRLVDHGAAREQALKLAHQLATFPQNCMRSDRLSAYEQWDLSWDEATRNEFTLGKQILDSGEAVAGARRFAGGEGKHGAFE